MRRSKLRYWDYLGIKLGRARLALILSVAFYCASFAGEAHARMKLTVCDMRLLVDSTRRQETAWKAFETGDVATARLIEKEIEMELQNSEVEAIEYIRQGSSEVYRVRLANGMYAIFKPSIDHWEYKRVREFHDERMPQREAAAYRLDRLIGAHMVPVTVMRTVDGQLGSLQIFVHVDSAVVSPSALRTERRMTILDYITGAHDRSPQNILRVDGGVVAIDNAMAFLLKAPHLAFGIQLPPKLTHVEALPDFQSDLRLFHSVNRDEFHRELGGLLTGEEIDGAFDRYFELIGRVQSGAPGHS